MRAAISPAFASLSGMPEMAVARFCMPAPIGVAE
jgi:hypothetical protein